MDEMNPSSLLSQSTPQLPGGLCGLGTPALGVSALGASAGPGVSEMELQKLLIDERMRCENHKMNYQTLKAEHTRLQEELSRAQAEVRELQGERTARQEKLQLQLAELRGELLDKTRALEESRLQVMTPQRLDLLRAQLHQEMEAPVRERFNKLEEEAERYRSEYNKLRYTYTLLKAQAEHQQQESARTLEERNMHFEAQLSHLEREKDDLVAQHRGSDPSRDGRRVEVLLREKAQLHLRLKSMEAEVAELRAQRDNSGQQADNVQRIQVRQLAESQAALKSLEAERQSVRSQLERVESEMRLAYEQNSTLTGRLHKAEREVSSLTDQVEGLKHSHKLDLNNVRLECARSKGELERERNALQGQMDALQTDVEVLRACGERQKEVLVEKEREMVRRVQAAREDELHKMAILHEEKLEVENRLSELEQQRALQDTAGHAHREEWEERLRGAQLGEESARKELQNLRTKLLQQTAHLEELERRKEELGDLRRQNQELGVRMGTLVHTEGGLQASNQRLKDAQDILREELRAARAQAERSQHDAERVLEERQVQWLEEKHGLQAEQDLLQHKYGQAKERLHRAAGAQKKRKAQTENKEKRLHNKIHQLEARIAELELESSTAKRRPSHSEEQTNLNRRLKELQRRHSEFRHLLLGHQAPTGTGPAFLPSSLFPPPPSAQVTEEHHLREVSQLYRRLEELESVQLHQMEELGATAQRDQAVSGQC
ncbi:centrosomal protein of 83 kDa isoform X1 [Gadus morhua]|uniref:Centrosomal protein of 83 kDa n=2 Tax=Gadus morhua TaxID=8049 RepID=A0A8C4ZAM2_GADMO|nr:centrosomal protein of 83 kDa isoform X1 [Gadus morhua]